MKQKTVILLMFVAFILMWACTPSSLRRDNNKEVSKVVGDLPQLNTSTLDTLKAIVPDVLPPRKKR